MRIGAGPWLATLSGVDIPPSTQIFVRLVGSADILDWFLEVTGTDELSTAPSLLHVNPTTHRVDFPATEVEFISPATLGNAIVFQSKVNTTSGPVLTVKFACYTLTAQGRRVGAVGETLEGNTSYGWTAIVNPLIRLVGGGGGFTAGGDLTGDGVSQTVVGLQTAPVSNEAPSELCALIFHNGMWRPMRITADMIQPVFVISSFSTGTPLAEVGQNIPNPAFTASYTNAPPYDYARLTDNNGNPPKDVTLIPTSFASNASFQKNTYGALVTFTLTAARSGVVSARQCTIEWGQRLYWGGAVRPGAYDSAFVKSLSNTVIATTKNRAYTINGGDFPGGKRLYLAYRDLYGASTFMVGVWEGGFTHVATVPVTNAFGFTENFRIYESNQVDLGIVDVVVS